MSLKRKLKEIILQGDYTMTKDYGKSYREYQDLKLETHTKHNEVVDTVKDWFFENYPSINIVSVYVNDRPMIDQLCLVLHEKLSSNILNSFSNEFQLELMTEFYRIRRQHNYSSLRNEHKDFEKWQYSFRVRI